MINAPVNFACCPPVSVIDTAVMNLNDKIYIAGHTGFVGSNLLQTLKTKGFKNFILKTREELNLLNQQDVFNFFKQEKPDYCFIVAGKVGGILYNMKYQADFLYENLIIAGNIIKAAADNKVKKLLYTGSSCIYPKFCPQPIKEDYLLTSALETSNEAYALAKIAGLKLCEKYREQYGCNFISVMPTNLYGPNDNFHPEHSHVIPGLLKRFYEAKIKKLPEVKVWGSGKAKREFLYIDDLCEALCLVMEKYDQKEIINIGTGQDLTIQELAEKIKQTVGYAGQITFDRTKPDGTPQKVLDITKITRLGWQAKHSLGEGLKLTYQWALKDI